MVYLYRLPHFFRNTLFAQCGQPVVLTYKTKFQQIKYGAPSVTITNLRAWFLLPLEFAMEPLLLLFEKNSLID